VGQVAKVDQLSHPARRRVVAGRTKPRGLGDAVHHVAVDEIAQTVIANVVVKGDEKIEIVRHVSMVAHRHDANTTRSLSPSAEPHGNWRALFAAVSYLARRASA
jgi:hypothetical protein